MGTPERDSRCPTINTFPIHSLLKCYSEEDKGKASTVWPPALRPPKFGNW